MSLTGPVENQNTLKLLKPGEIAPDFSLSCTPFEKTSLSQLRGRPVVLLFYPADWSPVCSDELSAFNKYLPEFDRLGAKLLAISVDGVWSHRAFKTAYRYEFPLLSDFEPKGQVARSYGAYREHDGFCERALFIVDRSGVVRWNYLSRVEINPGVTELLSEMEKISKESPRPREPGHENEEVA
jgi:peroxiredoxin